MKFTLFFLFYGSFLYTPLSYSKNGHASFSSKDFAHWLDYAYIADASYQSSETMTQVLKQLGYKATLQKQIEGFSVGFVLATNDETQKQIIAVRGTSNVENMIVDAAFVLVPDKISGISIHQGFLLAATDIYQQVHSKLKAGYKISTVGHSLGGAAALVLAMMLDAQGYEVDEVVTFGQPKVTNISGSVQFEHLDIIRLVTPKDIVPLMPPLDPMDLMNLSIFWHQGTEIILYENRQYSVLKGIGSMKRATDFLNDIPDAQHLSQHFMSTYIDHLKAKAIAADEIEYESDFHFSDWFGSGDNSGRR